MLDRDLKDFATLIESKQFAQLQEVVLKKFAERENDNKSYMVELLKNHPEWKDLHQSFLKMSELTIQGKEAKVSSDPITKGTAVISGMISESLTAANLLKKMEINDHNIADAILFLLLLKARGEYCKILDKEPLNEAVVKSFSQKSRLDIYKPIAVALEELVNTDGNNLRQKIPLEVVPAAEEAKLLAAMPSVNEKSSIKLKHYFFTKYLPAEEKRLWALYDEVLTKEKAKDKIEELQKLQNNFEALRNQQNIILGITTPLYNERSINLELKRIKQSLVIKEDKDYQEGKSSEQYTKELKEIKENWNKLNDFISESQDFLEGKPDEKGAPPEPPKYNPAIASFLKDDTLKNSWSIYSNVFHAENPGLKDISNRRLQMQANKPFVKNMKSAGINFVAKLNLGYLDETKKEQKKIVEGVLYDPIHPKGLKEGTKAAIEELIKFRDRLVEPVEDLREKRKNQRKKEILNSIHLQRQEVIKLDNWEFQQHINKARIDQVKDKTFYLFETSVKDEKGNLVPVDQTNWLKYAFFTVPSYKNTPNPAMQKYFYRLDWAAYILGGFFASPLKNFLKYFFEYLPKLGATKLEIWIEEQETALSRLPTTMREKDKLKDQLKLLPAKIGHGFLQIFWLLTRAVFSPMASAQASYETVSEFTKKGIVKILGYFNAKPETQEKWGNRMGILLGCIAALPNLAIGIAIMIATFTVAPYLLIQMVSGIGGLVGTSAGPTLINGLTQVGSVISGLTTSNYGMVSSTALAPLAMEAVSAVAAWNLVRTIALNSTLITGVAKWFNAIWKVKIRPILFDSLEKVKVIPDAPVPKPAVIGSSHSMIMASLPSLPDSHSGLEHKINVSEIDLDDSKNTIAQNMSHPFIIDNDLEKQEESVNSDENRLLTIEDEHLDDDRVYTDEELSAVLNTISRY